VINERLFEFNRMLGMLDKSLPFGRIVTANLLLLNLR
jgi:hypothetical protein